MAVHYDDRCLKAAVSAANGKLTEAEVLDAFKRVSDRKEALDATGDFVGSGEKLRRFAAEEAERTRIAAAMQRRHSALNIIVRDKQDAALRGLISGGVRPDRALRAVLEGTEKGVAGARRSADANRAAYRRRYLGGLFADLEAEKPHLLGMLKDQQFSDDVHREMVELRPDGKPGITGNSDAAFVAKTFAKHAELARTDLNSLGASIGKLLGWAGVQNHDAIKMLQAGRDAWVGRTIPRLDIDRTFTEGATGPEAARILGDIYDSIVTGVPNKATPREKGQRINPANLAKSLGKSRVLHFKDADAAIAYEKEFGHGNAVTSMIAHLDRASHLAGNMKTLGPNPELMFGSLAESMRRQVRESTAYSDEQKRDIAGKLDMEAGRLRQAFDVAVGNAFMPVDLKWARRGSNLRRVQSMAKLGGAIWSAVGGDTVTTAMASQFRGSGFFNGFTQQVGGVLQGRPKGEQGQIAFLIGDGFDGLIGHIVSPHAVQDGPVGFLSRLQTQFFKWNGLTAWTDIGRSVAGRTISSEMGMRAGTAYEKLPVAYRHVLGLHGIDAAKWSAIGHAKLREDGGRAFITPDRIRDLSDEAVAPLVADRIAAAKGDPQRISAMLGQARHDLEIDVLGFFADEVNFAVLTTDARTQRYTTLGLRPGTMGGEAARFIMQFKGFPLAFSERVLGRAFFGFGKGRGMDQAVHIGSLLAGLTMAGYASMTMKDLIKGNWPPRDPSDWRTWQASMLQGGALGIYGDYLFGQTSRFGNAPLETLSGVTIGSASDLLNIGLEARDYAVDAATGDEGKFSGGKALTWVTGNTPFANLFYVKPALDYLFLNSMREALSPGYLRRQETTRRRQYGQEPMRPLGLGSTLLGDLRGP